MDMETPGSLVHTEIGIESRAIIALDRVTDEHTERHVRPSCICIYMYRYMLLDKIVDFRRCFIVTEVCRVVLISF